MWCLFYDILKTTLTNALSLIVANKNYEKLVRKVFKKLVKRTWKSPDFGNSIHEDYSKANLSEGEHSSTVEQNFYSWRTKNGRRRCKICSGKDDLKTLTNATSGLVEYIKNLKSREVWNLKLK